MLAAEVTRMASRSEVRNEEAESSANSMVADSGTWAARLGPISEHLAGAISRSFVAIARTTWAASHGGEDVGEAVADAEDMGASTEPCASWFGPAVEHLVGAVGRSSGVALEATREPS